MGPLLISRRQADFPLLIRGLSFRLLPSCGHPPTETCYTARPSGGWNAMNEPQPDHILQVGLGFWASKTLLSAVEMQVFTELAKHPQPLPEIGARLGLHPRSARDFLDALVALKFLERREGIYCNTPAT